MFTPKQTKVSHNKYCAHGWFEGSVEGFRQIVWITNANISGTCLKHLHEQLSEIIFLSGTLNN